MVVNGQVNVKDRGEYKKASIRDLETNKQCMVMCMHTGIKQVDYTPIDSFNLKNYKGVGYAITIENTLEKQTEIVGTEQLQVYSANKGFIPIKDIAISDIIVDDEGRWCKLVKKTETMIDDVVFALESRYNNNFYYNGILVKS
jgi:hypothetical protein